MKQFNEILDKKMTKLSIDVQKTSSSILSVENIPLEQDPSLPTPTTIKIRDAIAAKEEEKRVKISGWVHRLRRQGKSMIFVVLRDGTGYLQCFFDSKMVNLLCLYKYLDQQFASKDARCRIHNFRMWNICGRSRRSHGT